MEYSLLISNLTDYYYVNLFLLSWDSMEQHDKATKNQITVRIAERFRKRGRMRTAPPSAQHPPAHQKWLRNILTCGGILGAVVGAITLSPDKAASAVQTDAERQVELTRNNATSSRSLTYGESAILHALFGDDFDTKTPKIYFHEKFLDEENYIKKNGNGMAGFILRTDLNSVHIRHDYHADDYGHTQGTQFRTKVFLHEFAHIWQHRANIGAERCTVYEYTLTEQSKLSDFCSEQQAEILADYGMRFLIPEQPEMNSQASIFLHGYSASKATGMPMATIDTLNENDKNLIRVVESVLPQVAARRLRMQKNYNNVARCRVDRALASPATTFYDHKQACEDLYLRTVGNELLNLDMDQGITTPNPPSPAQKVAAKAVRTTSVKPPKM